jgi:beta-ketoacyl synthase-like protein
MGRVHDLQVVRWAGISVDRAAGASSVVGAAEDAAIPAGIRRRMGRLERLAVRCALGVLDGEPTDELIFCSRSGNLETLLSLLRGIAGGELLSPMAFSGSVHNAVPGHVGQIRNERIRHTALAAGARTLVAGLIEAYTRLVCDDASDVTVVYADQAMPELFGELTTGLGRDLAFAVRLSAADDAATPNGRIASIADGWPGVEEFYDALGQGMSRIGGEVVAGLGAVA